MIRTKYDYYLMDYSTEKNENLDKEKERERTEQSF